MLAASSGDFDIVDRDCFATVFQKLEIDVAKLAGWYREYPTIFFLFDFGRRAGGELLDAGDGGRVEVGSDERTHCEGGRLSVFSRTKGFDRFYLGGSDGENGEFMHATRSKNIDASVAGSGGKF
ncbi:MAG: hypothetical protein QMC23_11945 [Rubritalea sp.]